MVMARVTPSTTKLWPSCSSTARLRSRWFSATYVLATTAPARLLEQMENSGLVGSLQPNGSRELIVPKRDE